MPLGVRGLFGGSNRNPPHLHIWQCTPVIAIDVRTRRSLLGPNSAHLVSSEREILGIEPGQSVNVPRCTVAAVLKQTCGSLGPNRDLETLSPLTYYNK